MKSLHTEDFNLEYTIESGTLFRWTKKGSVYYVVAGSRVLKLRQEGNDVLFSASSPMSAAELSRYLGLDCNYPDIIAEITKDPLVNKAVSMFPGMRLLRQEPRECLLSYICSAFSNIPRIKGNLNNLALCFGKPVLFDNRTFFTFPEKLDNPQKIQGCGVGYRYKYLYEASRMAGSQWLNGLRTLSYSNAKQELKSIPGVGDKVADCVLLFSLGFTEAFPVDTWMKKGMSASYFGGKQMPEPKIREFAKANFGRCAGYAQQFLFHYWRTTKEFK